MNLKTGQQERHKLKCEEKKKEKNRTSKNCGTTSRKYNIYITRIPKEEGTEPKKYLKYITKNSQKLMTNPEVGDYQAG